METTRAFTLSLAPRAQGDACRSASIIDLDKECMYAYNCTYEDYSRHKYFFSRYSL